MIKEEKKQMSLDLTHPSVPNLDTERDVRTNVIVQKESHTVPVRNAFEEYTSLTNTSNPNSSMKQSPNISSHKENSIQQSSNNESSVHENFKN